MNKTFLIQKLTWVFAVFFLIISAISNIPIFNNIQRSNFGFFKIDPMDTIAHLLTAIIGAIAAWHSARLSRWFLIVFGSLYWLDAFIGLGMGRGLLDLSIFTQGAESPDFSQIGIAINAPQIALAVAMISVGVSCKIKNKVPVGFENI